MGELLDSNPSMRHISIDSYRSTSKSITKNSPRGKLHRPKFLKLVGLKYCGRQETYDIVMKEPNHNFIANGFVVHNSQESLRYVRPTVSSSGCLQISQGKREEIKSVVEDIEKSYRVA